MGDASDDNYFRLLFPPSDTEEMDDASDNNNRREQSQGAGGGTLPGTVTHTFTIESTNTGVEEMANRIEMRFEALMAQNIENQESTSRLTSQVAELVRMHEEQRQEQEKQRQEQEKQQEATDKKIDGIVAFLDRLTQQGANMKQDGAGKGTSFCHEEPHFDETVHLNPALQFRQQDKRLPDGRINFEWRHWDTTASRAGLTPTEKAIKDILPQIILEHEAPIDIPDIWFKRRSTIVPINFKLRNADGSALGSLLRMQTYLFNHSDFAYNNWAYHYASMLVGDFQQLRDWAESTKPSWTLFVEGFIQVLSDHKVVLQPTRVS